MKIKMLETQRGSVDGCRVKTYEAGVEYDLSASAGAKDLARAFVDAGFAEAADGVTAHFSKAQAAQEPTATNRDPAPHWPAGESVAVQVEEAPEAAAEPVQAPAQGRGRRKK